MLLHKISTAVKNMFNHTKRMGVQLTPTRVPLHELSGTVAINTIFDLINIHIHMLSQMKNIVHKSPFLSKSNHFFEKVLFVFVEVI